MNGTILCGWYTADYAHWVGPLRASIDRLGYPHDFVEVRKAEGGWEVNTLRKADQIIAAMRRHPGKTIIFLDVDCEVRKPLDTLAEIQGDFGVHLRHKSRLKVRSGTMVFRPTQLARSLVECWRENSYDVTKGTVDQQTLLAAMFQVPGLTITNLDVSYCAVAADRLQDPAIMHLSGSSAHKVLPLWVRPVYRAFGVRSKSIPSA